MNICIYGAGAVGGHMAARLLAGGVARISVVARGAQLRGIQDGGFTMTRGDRTFKGRPLAATDNPSELEPQDLVIVTLKAASLPAAAEPISRLLAPGGSVVFMTNGIPWWWNQGLNAEAGHLPLLDPQGKLWSLLRERTLGGVVYSGNRIVAPGVIQGYGNDRWFIGEPAFSRDANHAVVPVASPRRDAAVALLANAGFPASGTDDIRKEVWRKLIMNAAMNTVAALTRLPAEQLSIHEDVRALLITIMNESLAVARAAGWELAKEVDVNALAGPTPDRSPGQRPSMLQDVLAGRPMEVDAILGQLVRFGEDFSVATPACRLVLTLLQGLDHSRAVTA